MDYSVKELALKFIEMGYLFSKEEIISIGSELFNYDRTPEEWLELTQENYPELLEGKEII